MTTGEGGWELVRVNPGRLGDVGDNDLNVAQNGDSLEVGGERALVLAQPTEHPDSPLAERVERFTASGR